MMDIFLQEISGKYAHDWVTRISGYHRMKANSEFEEILLQIQKELYRIGYSKNNVSHQCFPADGTSKAWEWMRTQQWEVKHAECWINSPIKKRISSYEDLPLSLICYSKSAKKTAELVEIRKGDTEDGYSSLNLTGKIVLISNSVYQVHKHYEKFGAIGALVYPDFPKSRIDPEMIVYDTLLGSKEDLEQSGFGFSISFEQAYQLKQLLFEGPVKLRVDIDTEVFDGKFHSLSAIIPGCKEPQKEIIIMGHLCHPNPGANDNASGSALTLEIARTIKRLLDQKRIEIPDYTIRFLWTAEYMGTVIWQKANTEFLKNCVAMINLDMVGLSLLKSGNPLEISLESITNPSWFQILLPYLAHSVSNNSLSIATHGNHHPLIYRITPFVGGSDHTLFTDPFFGIPSVMFSGEDPFYHSSIDTPDKIDPTRLKRVATMTLFLAYFYGKQEKRNLKELFSLIQTRLQSIFTKGTMLIYTKFSSADSDLLWQGDFLLELCYHHSESLLKNIHLQSEANEYFRFFEEFIKDKYQFEHQQWEKFRKIHKSIQISKNQEKNSIKFKRSNYKQRYQLNISGPVPNSILSSLFEFKIVQQLLKDVNSRFGGVILELFFLLRKKSSILEIWGYLSMEYGVFLQITKIKELILLLKKHRMISDLSHTLE